MHVSSALVSYSQLLRLLSDGKERQSRNVWFVLLSFLTHAAMVSKLLDPIRPEGAKEDRGTALRKHLEVEDGSAILSRAARDNLEHIDERIDRWTKRGLTSVLEMVFEDRAGFEFIAHEDAAIRRVLIQDEMIFISEDRNGNRLETALTPIYGALKDLKARCEHKLATESPYTYLLAQALRSSEP